MSNDELNAYLMRYVPLARAMGVYLRRFDATGVTLAAPLAPNVNDKGTAFGGALASILSLSGWALCYLLLKEHGEEANLVIADSTIKYWKPVQEEIIAVCSMPDAVAVERFLGNYQKRGKASWTLEAAINANGEAAVTFRGRYAAIRPV